MITAICLVVLAVGLLVGAVYAVGWIAAVLILPLVAVGIYASVADLRREGCLPGLLVLVLACVPLGLTAVAGWAVVRAWVWFDGVQERMMTEYEQQQREHARRWEEQAPEREAARRRFEALLDREMQRVAQEARADGEPDPTDRSP